MLRDIWEEKLAKAKAAAKHSKYEIEKLEHKATQVMERILATTSPMLINAYEGEIQRIEEEKLVLMEKSQKTPEKLKTFEEAYPTALEFLANPWNLWASDEIEERRMLLRLAFTGRLPYCRESGYPTTKTAIPFKALGDLRLGKSDMVLLIGETSNTPDLSLEAALATLEDWDTYLKSENIDFSDLSLKPDKSRLRGPSP